jgi:hypothetical protein
MIHRLTCWLAVLILSFLCLVAPVRAQPAPNQQPVTPPIPQGPPQLPGGEKVEKTPAIPYTLAGMATLLMLLIVCKPSRKG